MQSFDWIPNAPPIGNLWKCMELVTADIYQERRMTGFALADVSKLFPWQSFINKRFLY